MWTLSRWQNLENNIIVYPFELCKCTICARRYLIKFSPKNPPHSFFLPWHTPSLDRCSGSSDVWEHLLHNYYFLRYWLTCASYICGILFVTYISRWKKCILLGIARINFPPNSGTLYNFFPTSKTKIWVTLGLKILYIT